MRRNLFKIITLSFLAVGFMGLGGVLTKTYAQENISLDESTCFVQGASIRYNGQVDKGGDIRFQINIKKEKLDKMQEDKKIEMLIQPEGKEEKAFDITSIMTLDENYPNYYVGRAYIYNVPVSQYDVNFNVKAKVTASNVTTYTSNVKSRSISYVAKKAYEDTNIIKTEEQLKQLELSVPLKTIKKIETETFGKSNAKVTLESFNALEDGIKVTIDYTKDPQVFGFGIMFGDNLGNAYTDLYAIGFKTIDHKVYGDWNWQGNYIPVENLGVKAEERDNQITLIYSYKTLKNYGLDIDKNSESIKYQLFEYVLDGSGNRYGIYNCMNVNGQPSFFDIGINNFLEFKLKDIKYPTYEYLNLGSHNINVQIEKRKDGLQITYKAKETANLFGLGICIDVVDGLDLSILYATTGNIAKMAYGNWNWEYKLPQDNNIIASRKVEGEYTISSMFLSYDMLGMSGDFNELGICLFEVVNSSGAQYGIYNCMEKDGNQVIIDGGTANFVKAAF